MVRILDAAAVDSLLSEKGVLDAMRDLFRLAVEPGSTGYGRINLAHPNGWMRTLPGFIRPLGVVGFKVLNRADGIGMRYTIYVHDLASGALRGVVDGLEITNLRTGAVSAVGTEHLAVEDVAVMALIGTGPVAQGQLRALELVRSADEIRVFARTPENRERFIAEMSEAVRGRLVEAASLDEAVEGAAVVTLATKAVAPILFRRHLTAGMHVNSVGPASRDRMEVDPKAFGAFDRLVCDSVDLVLDEAGDAFQAVEQGHLDPAAASDLSAVVSGARPGRTDESQLTLFKSVGTGLQDLMVAARLLEEAAASDAGTVVEDFSAVKPLPNSRA